MLDAKILREQFNEVKENLKKRQDDEIISRLDSWKEKDEEWRTIKYELEDLKKQRNEITEKIKKSKKPIIIIGESALYGEAGRYVFETLKKLSEL